MMAASQTEQGLTRQPVDDAQFEEQTLPHSLVSDAQCQGHISACRDGLEDDLDGLG